MKRRWREVGAPATSSGAGYTSPAALLARVACCALIASVGLGMLACTTESGRPPIARASANPAAIVENDGFRTRVTLDGTASADPLDDPTAELPLRYHWRVLFDEHRFVEGDQTSVSPVIELRGDRPATIELTVSDGDGDASTVRFQMQLTVRR